MERAKKYLRSTGDVTLRPSRSFDHPRKKIKIISLVYSNCIFNALIVPGIRSAHNYTDGVGALNSEVSLLQE